MNDIPVAHPNQDRLDGALERREALTAAVPTLRWVNHASFVFEYPGVRLISDPWLDGPAFHDGWNLLSETKFRYEDFDAITHIWISHQHPDHFSPPNLRSIPPEMRAKITVLYQQTKDKLVVHFLRGLRFKAVVELKPSRWYALAPGVEILCRPLGDDSWLAIRTPGGTLLNINDCVVDTEAVAASIARRVGPVRVLLTQFSFANWAGNAEDRERRRREGREKLERIRLQSRFFDPDYIIPFASFVWFSHEENFYHNLDVNRVGDVVAFVERQLDKKAVVLYPGDAWTVGEPHESRSATERYERDLERRIAQGPCGVARAMDIDRVLEAAQTFLRRLRSRTSGLIRFPGIKTSVGLSDYDAVFEISVNGMRRVDGARVPDIVTHSESLFYCFHAPWGANALNVNGRFVEPAGGDHRRFFLFFRLADLYGRARLDLRWLAGRILQHGMRFFNRKLERLRRAAKPG